jgi:cell division protein FtsB
MTRRNRSRTVMERRQRASWGVLVIVGLVVGGFLLVSLLFDERGLPKYLEMRKRADRLEAEIKALQKNNGDLRAEISRVQHDPVRIEELARERLGLVRKGETVYQIVEEPAPGSNDVK